jgi:putative membrane-bound dehydrogenase-like protein
MMRIWNAATGRWTDTSFPTQIVASDPEGKHRDRGLKFGSIGPGREVEVFFRDEQAKGAWHFDGTSWREDPDFFSGLSLKGQPLLTVENGHDRGVRLRDVDHDGRCELLVGNESQNGVFAWAETERRWKKLSYSLPEGTSIVDAAGEDNGLRFVDINGDGYDDLLFSNPSAYSVHLFISKPKPLLGWEVGWSYQMRAGKHGEPGEIPMIVRSGPHCDNGAWFHSGTLWVQNEDTAQLPDKVSRVSFQDLQLGNSPPPKSPEQALASFRLPPGFKIELLASEPLITDPAAFDWGPDGKLWVVEMRDYPIGMDGEGKPGGEVRILEDTDSDGRYDKVTVFLEGLRFPNGILPWGKGVLVSAAPDIFYAEDTDGDGKADVRKLLFTGFREGNQQHRINGFDYGLDNWIYAANGGSGGIVRSVANNQELDLRGHDLRFRPDDGSMELQPGATQFGRHRDDWGNWFGNDNSRWLWHYHLPEHYLARNRYLAVGSTSRMLANYPNANRLYAISQPQQRFNWPKAIFEVTSACSATPYRDELFGPEFDSSIFICEPANNVIHREVLQADGVSFVSHRAASETNSEFLTSNDNWSRPVMLKTGPDGALYFADMYRLIIEHPEYFPDELKHRPDLRAGEDKGRIYRIYPADAKLRKIPRLDRFSVSDLVAALDSPNGWQRDTVQRLLVELQDKAAVKGLEGLLEGNKNSKVRLQALCTLDGLYAIRPQLLVKALGDSHYLVRREAVRLCESRFGQSRDLDARVLELADDPDLRVRYQLAFSLGEWSDQRAGTTLGRIAFRDWSEQAMQTAVLSSATRHLPWLLTAALAGPREQLPPDLVEHLVGLATDMSDDSVLTKALDQIVVPIGQRYSAWQCAGLAGLLDALDRQNMALSTFQDRAGTGLQKVLSSLEPLFAQGRQVAGDASASETERLMAIRLLDRGANQQEQDVTLLGELLGPQSPGTIQKAALAELRRGTGTNVAQALLKSWRTSGLTQRQEILNALFSRSEWTQALLSSLEGGSLSPSEMGPLQEQKLLNHSVPAIRESASRLFSTIDADRQKIVAAYKDVEELTGDRARGHKLFVQNCAICHRLHGEGQNIGPDLGTVADKPVPEIVVAILDPNQAVDPSYTAYTAVTKDDRELSGVLVTETPNSISLRMAAGAEETIFRSNLKELTSSGRSLMPEGFEAGLKPQDLADLIACILSPKP